MFRGRRLGQAVRLENLALGIPVLVLAWFLRASFAPWEWFYNSGDPDFLYWFNALLVLEGQSPAHIDHPGTPVQLLGAMVLHWRYLLSGTGPNVLEDFSLHILDYHRAYFVLVVTALLASAWICGYRLRRLGIGLPTVMLIQLAPLFVFDGVKYAFQITPEAWIVVAYFLWLPLLARVALSGKCDAREAVAHGILFGLLVSLKLHTASGAFLLLFLPTWRSRLTAAASAAFFFLCITAPLWDQYPRFVGWAVSLLVAREGYGQGGVGLPSQAWMLSNWLGIWSEKNARAMQVLLFAFPLLIPLALRAPARRRFVWPVLAGAALSCFLVLKQTHGSRYFLILLPFLAMFLLELRALPRLVRGLILAASFAYVAHVSVENADITSRHRAMLAGLEGELRPLLDGEYAGCVHVSKLVPIREMALFGGNASTWFNRYARTLERLFPRHRFYFEGQGVYHFDDQVQPDARGLFATERFPCQVLFAQAGGPIPDAFPPWMMKNLVPLGLTAGGSYQVYGDRFHFRDR